MVSLGLVVFFRKSKNSDLHRIILQNGVVEAVWCIEMELGGSYPIFHLLLVDKEAST